MSSCSQKETKKNHDYKPTAFACADCSLRFSADFYLCKTSVFEGVLKQAAGYVVVPFQNGIATIGGYLSDRSDELAQLKDVLALNKDLQEQIDQLTIRKQPAAAGSLRIK